MLRKSIVIRPVAVVVSALMLLAVSAGCKSDDIYESRAGTGIDWDPSEYVFLAEDIPFPDDLGDIGNFTYHEGKLYFSSVISNREYEDTLYLNSSTVSIYSINIDGTELTKLAGYVPPITRPENTGGWLYIQGMEADGEGNLWVVEGWTFYSFNLPAGFDNKTENPWEYSEVLDTGYVVRKLDAVGAELLCVDISSIKGQQEYFSIPTFTVDNSVNIYLYAQTQEHGNIIYVLDKTGNLQFQLDTSSYIDRFVRMPDGTIAFPDSARELQTIDISAKNFGEKVVIPAAGMSYGNEQYYTGGGEFDILISDGTGIYGYIFGAEESVKLLSWIDSNVIIGNLPEITALSDGRILCVNITWTSVTKIEPFILTKTPKSEIPEKTVLTMAVFGLDYTIDNAVIAYNRKSSDYRIEVKDYTQYGTFVDMEGLTRLIVEITAGELPDILGIQGMPYLNFVEKGLLADLYPFIDSDPELDRSDFVQAAFKAAEINGGLYQVFPSFYVDTLIGNSSVVGADMGWDYDEFTAFLDAHPDADIPIGSWMTGTMFLRRVLNHNMGEYIDWETGAVSFDTPGFVQLLELCSRLPKSDSFISRGEALLSGRQIISWHSISNLNHLYAERHDFGGEITFKGYPSSSGNGSIINTWESFAIIESSPHKDAAWAFVRTLLSESWQLERGGQGMPTNQAAFDKAVNSYYEADFDNQWMGFDGVRINLSSAQVREDIETILTVIDSASGGFIRRFDEVLLDVICEDASDYFNGLCSAEDAARRIQNRVSVYVSERN